MQHSYFRLPPLFLLALPLAVPIPAAAQNPSGDPALEVFAGFSTIAVRPGRLDGKDLSRVRQNGWTATLTSYQLLRRWGLTAELSGQHGGGSSHRALFGGTFRGFSGERFALTGRVLAGVTRWDPDRTSGAAMAHGVYPRQNAFTFGFGQSIDLRWKPNVTIRLQPDLLFVRMADGTNRKRTQLQTPFAAGLVWRFGRR